MPKEAICTGPEQLTFKEYAEPPLAAGQVRVEAQFAAIKHGTELELYRGHAERRGHYDERLQVFRKGQAAETFPFGIGNMIVGRVSHCAPDVRGLTVGDRVLAYGGLKPTHILDEEQCWPLAEEVPWQSAVCLDPADFALAAVRDSHLRLGDDVAVFGLGAISLIIVQMARRAGAGQVIGVDPLGMRREQAKALGASCVLNPLEHDVGLELKQLTAGRGVDVAIEYSGNPQALQAALRGVAYGGTVVCGAFPPPYPAGLDLGAEAHMNVPSLVFSRACSEPLRDHPRWTNRRVYDTCFSMLTTGQVTGIGILSDPVPFEDSLNAFAAMAKDPSKQIKIGVAFQQAAQENELASGAESS